MKNLFQNGKLVKIHVGMWSMAHALTKEDLDYQGDLPDIVQPGKKFLIKPKYYNEFKRIENQARGYLRRNSFNYLTDSFVPAAKFVSVLTELRSIKEEYDKLADEFCQNYEELKQETLDAYPEWKHKLERFYPKNDLALRSRFSFIIQAYEIQMPRNFENIDIHQHLLREKNEQEVREAFEREMAVQQQELLKNAEAFVFDSAKQLREKVTESVNGILARIHAGHNISKANIKTLQNTQKMFHEMNIFDDKEVVVALNKLDEIIELNPNGIKDDKSATNKLELIIKEIKQVTEDIDNIANASGEFYRNLG